MCQRSLAGNAAVSPLEATDLISAVKLEAVAISPDGLQVAYATQQFDREQLWLTSITGGTQLRIGDPQAENSDPVWSPDGKEVAFFTTSGKRSILAIWDASSKRVRITNVAVSQSARYISGAQWTPDSRGIVVSELANAPPVTPDRPTATPTPAVTILTSEPHRENAHAVTPQPFIHELANLSMVEAATGASAPIAVGVRPFRYQLSRDGTKIFYTVVKGAVASDVNNRTVFDIIVVDLRNHSTRVVAENILTSFGASSITWSPNSSKIAFIGGNLRNDFEIPTGDFHGANFPQRCYVIDIDHPGVLRRIGDRVLLPFSIVWSDDGSTIYANTWNSKSIVKISLATGASTSSVTWKNATTQQLLPASNGTFYAVVQTDNGENQFREFNTRSGASKLIFRSLQSLRFITFSRDGTYMAYKGEDISHPADVWIANVHAAHRYQRTHLNPQLESRPLGMAKNVSWKVHGATFQGTLLLPVAYHFGRRYPMVTYVYAGEPTGTKARTFFGGMGLEAPPYLNVQLLASRSYAVFIPDSILRVGHPMHDIADVILPGLNKIVAMGIADPARLGVLGQSYGGYSVLSLVVQTKRFKAAVAAYGL